MLREQRIENGAGLVLARVGLVGRIRRERDRQRVEDRGLVVCRILRGERRHGIAIRPGPLGLADALVVRVEVRRGVDVGALSLGFRGQRPGRGNRGEAQLQLRGRFQPGRERIPPSAERDAPLRHRARRVCFQCRVERIDGSRELERMQQRDGAVERGLGRGAARGLEVHRRAAPAELYRVRGPASQMELSTMRERPPSS